MEFETMNGPKVFTKLLLKDAEVSFGGMCYRIDLLVDNVPGYDMLLEDKYQGKLAYDRRTPSKDLMEAIDQLLSKTELPQGIEATEVVKKLTEYSIVFDEDLTGGISGHRLELPLNADAVPIRHPPRRMSPKELQELRRFRDDNLRAGIIEKGPGTSLWSHRMVFKKEVEVSGKQKIRVCSDLRDVNESSVWVYFPIPVIEELLPILCGSAMFMVMDLKKGFYQLWVSEDSRDQLTFTVDGVNYRYTRVPFGHKNAPGVFQKTIQEIIGDLLYKGVLLYIDDIFIYRKAIGSYSTPFVKC
jgi:hypothetical protein